MKNLFKNIKCPRWKKSIRFYYGWKWNMLNTNGHGNIVWKGFSMFNGPLHKKACWRSSYKHVKTQKMAKSKPKFQECFCHWPNIHTWRTWYFLLRGCWCCQCYNIKSKSYFEANCTPQCFCWKWTMECDSHERWISSLICSHYANYLPKGMVDLF
jgi:hypothetical protein